MNSFTHEDPDRTAGADEVARLIGDAGARPAPAAEVQATILLAVEREWRIAQASRKRWRNRRLALAAGVAALALGLSVEVPWHKSVPDLTVVATVVDSRGPVRMVPATTGSVTIAGATLTAGTSVETGTNGAALLNVAGIGVRAGPDTVLTLERPGRIRLLRGRIYLETAAQAHAGDLEVVTEFGILKHLGTQYQVTVQPGRYLLTIVREGRVRMEAFGHVQTIERGEGLRIAGGGAITRLTIPAYDAQWHWVSDFVPEFLINGRSLSAFLDWFVRETGRTVVFVEAAARHDADDIMLKGSIRGLTPDQALDAVVATGQFQYDLSTPGQLRMSVATGGGVR